MLFITNNCSFTLISTKGQSENFTRMLREHLMTFILNSIAFSLVLPTGYITRYRSLSIYEKIWKYAIISESNIL